MDHEVILRMHNINKAFPGVQALDNINFELRKGEVHCLLGENGAGKSTLIKIMSGAHQKDSGTIFLHGKEVDIKDAHTSRDLGISTIYQEMSLIPGMSVAENIFLGEEIVKSPFYMVDKEKMEKQAEEIFREMNIDINPKRLIKEISTAQQQMVEIARSLVKKRQIIIMDEPTSSISDKDTNELFRIIRKLKSQGVAIIYISHRLQELSEIVDRITVMRDGKDIGTVTMKDVTIDQLITMMVGRTLEKMDKPVNEHIGEVLLEVKNTSWGNVVQNASFILRRGEILGFAGLVGAGRSELMRLLFGAEKMDSGTILLQGKEVEIHSPVQAIKHGIGYLSEDRKRDGLVLSMGIDQNITMANLASVCNGFLVSRKKERLEAENTIQSLDVATSSIHKLVKFLSGGNQQKVIIGKWLLTDCKVLIFDEPTRGIDVGARAEIYKLMNGLAQAGKSIIMVSSDLPEIIRVSNRVIVMNQGRIAGEFDNDGTITQEGVMPLMLGGVGNVS
jgi:ribose transport system ATP-binding protein